MTLTGLNPNCQVFPNDYHELVPRGWVPDPKTTGGMHPPQTLMIPHDEWLRTGKPGSIEEYNEAVVRLLPMMPGVCPLCGK